MSATVSTPSVESEAGGPAADTGKSSLRRLIPRRVRLSLYEMSPGRRRRWRQFPALERLPGGSSLAALTFDDGPGELTPELLAALAEHDLRATFFLLGEQARRRPDVARDVAAAGHEVGLHGSEHLRHDQVESQRAAEDVRRGLAEVEEACGVRPRWYRPPFGKFSEASFRASAELGLRPAYWSTWGYDWEAVGVPTIVRRVLRGLDPGAIVLLHDSARYAERASARPTVDAIPKLARALTARQLETVTLSDGMSPQQ
ncbi:MAG TPA: polysaccharide deacetylase family protein [Solirubrobacteraceae bacterium]|jgi:peptidoglycan/xylan/chitin deacetylase (PgdA/CDA1 family)|nr:polysaccharide deacetylase family protein [Solirubrobacteraceae bacterium]